MIGQNYERSREVPKLILHNQVNNEVTEVNMEDQQQQKPDTACLTNQTSLVQEKQISENQIPDQSELFEQNRPNQNVFEEEENIFNEFQNEQQQSLKRKLDDELLEHKAKMRKMEQESMFFDL